jgi:two-component system cell cycle sensor histidine kinase/response regulator CckA
MSVKKPLGLLIVEDCESDAELLLLELRRGGYDPSFERVETAPAMSAALDRRTWDLVLSDFSLPQFSGPAALSLLQQRRLDLPFIVVSGTVNEETAVAAMKAGASDFVTKGKLARLIPAVERELREARDRRARRQAEVALQESEQRFRSLIENMSGLIAILTPEGVITYGSPSVAHTLGYGPEALVGENLASYLHPEDTDLLTGFREEVLRRPGALASVEFRVRHQDGSWRTLGAMGRNLVDNPGVRGIVLNARDITQRRQLEEQLRQSQKMEAIGLLAGGVAHDFNNMLGAITGYSDLLLHRLGPDDAGREYVQEIMNAAERAANLTRQLLIFSRKEVLTPQVLDLSETVAGLQKMLGRLIGEDIELVTTSDAPLGRVKADPGQIEQIVLNLAVNARDAMPDGGRITLETRNLVLEAAGNSEEPAQGPAFWGRQGRHVGVPPGAYVLLVISDTGCGMDAETQARIFEPFFTTKEHGQGTGLGLATVYGIVEQNGGHITVESEPGEGTTFRIYVPRTAESVQGEQNAAAAASPGSETVLLVEDEEIVRRLIQQVLQMHGYSVLEAARGEEALEWCAAPQSIDLLLTDVVMPGMSGRELAERAALVRPEMKVLFMSGYTDDVVVRHGVLDADIAFIQKPFTPAALTQKVREVLGQTAAAAPYQARDLGQGRVQAGKGS